MTILEEYRLTARCRVCGHVVCGKECLSTAELVAARGQEDGNCAEMVADTCRSWNVKAGRIHEALCHGSLVPGHLGTLWLGAARW